MFREVSAGKKHWDFTMTLPKPHSLASHAWVIQNHLSAAK